MVDFYITQVGAQEGGTPFTPSFKIDGIKNLKIDCIFNAIHGTPGEDGKMQKYFSDKKIPITGSNAYQSELTFDKVKCLNFLSSKGIKVAPSISISKNDKINLTEIEAKVGFPCFVKASNSGSSFGVYKVYNKDEMVNCLDSAFEVDNKVLVESHINGREFSIGVISFNGNKIITCGAGGMVLTSSKKIETKVRHLTTNGAGGET